MTEIFVVDTNVVLVANGQHNDVRPDCVADCALRLESIMAQGRVALDARFEVLQEYQNKTQPIRAKRPGDVFVKWVLQHRSVRSRCDAVEIPKHPERGYEAFPDDPLLSKFDTSDRKFVAIALCHADRPKILQGTDSKWVEWSPALSTHGVEVEFLCHEDIKRFHKNKKR